VIGATGLILLVAGWIIGFIDIAINEDEVTWVTHSSVVSQCLGGSMLLYSLGTLLVRYAP
jgi:hypothetical protein